MSMSGRQSEATHEDGASSSSNGRYCDSRGPQNHHTPYITRDSVYLPEWASRMGHAGSSANNGNQYEPSRPRYVPRPRESSVWRDWAYRGSGEGDIGTWKPPRRGPLRAGSVPGLGGESREVVGGAGGGERNTTGVERRPLVAPPQLGVRSGGIDAPAAASQQPRPHPPVAISDAPSSSSIGVPSSVSRKRRSRRRRSRTVETIDPVTGCPVTVPPQRAAAAAAPSSSSSSAVTTPSFSSVTTPSSSSSVTTTPSQSRPISRPALSTISSPQPRPGPVAPSGPPPPPPPPPPPLHPLGPVSIIDSVPSSSETVSLQPVLRPSSNIANTPQSHHPSPVSLSVPPSHPDPRPAKVALANPAPSSDVAANQQAHLRPGPIVTSDPGPSPAVSDPRRSPRPVLVLRPPRVVAAAPQPRPPAVQVIYSTSPTSPGGDRSSSTAPCDIYGIPTTSPSPRDSNSRSSSTAPSSILFTSPSPRNSNRRSSSTATCYIYSILSTSPSPRDSNSGSSSSTTCYIYSILSTSPSPRNSDSRSSSTAPCYIYSTSPSSPSPRNSNSRSSSTAPYSIPHTLTSPGP
ncbi:hypothetical protein P167DRAFT_550505, partial [Morchella conica CCBAS932]